MRTIDYAVIIIYVITFIAIGVLVSKKKVKSAKDYSTAGQAMDLKTVIGSTVATCMGASIIFGNYQLVYQGGIKAYVSILSWDIGWLFLILMSNKLRASGAASMPQFLEIKYGKKARTYASFAVLCMGASSTAAQYSSIGSMCKSLNICDKNVGMIVGAIVILLFTVFSGLWGVAITDTIQSVMIVAVVGLVIPFTAAIKAGGITTAIAAIPAEKLTLAGQGMTTAYMLGLVLTNIFSCGAHPAYAQRTFAAKDAKTAQRGQLISMLICATIQFVAATPALYMNEIYPEMTDGSLFVARFVADYFPPVLTGLVLAIILGLLLTTGDTFLLLLSSTITEDIIRPNKPDIEDKKLLRIGRIVCVAATGLLVFFAMAIPSITDLFKLGSSVYGCSCFFPLFLGCFWKKINAKAVEIAIPVGMVISLAWDLLLKAKTGTSGSFYAGPVCLVICILGSLYFNSKQNKVA